MPSLGDFIYNASKTYGSIKDREANQAKALLEKQESDRKFALEQNELLRLLASDAQDQRNEDRRYNLDREKLNALLQNNMSRQDNSTAQAITNALSLYGGLKGSQKNKARSRLISLLGIGEDIEDMEGIQPNNSVDGDSLLGKASRTIGNLFSRRKDNIPGT